MRRNDDVEAALLRQTTRTKTGCLERSGAAIRGYPVVKLAGKQHRASRLAYETWVGPISEGLTIDHLCRNTRCIEPTHLEAVTNAENARRGRAAGKPTHCPSGHAYAEHGYENGGRTHCRECRRARHRRWVDENRERNRELKRESYARTRAQRSG